ncbi:MAG: HK97 family phage prohead protease [Lachnospiraceae bacterium]|nr:HK97 family phage prohead protease [Lachnospiraceae bacterium]
MAAPKTGTTETEKRKNDNFREFIDCSIRAAEGEGKERTFTLSFSSEEPYDRWFGPEILDHSDGCMDLNRLNSIGVVLYNHSRDKVIGKIDRAWVENGRGCAEITFDSDDASETIYQKVKGGTLKGVSVGYMVDNWEEVMPGKMSEDGRFTGPCSIAKKWVPYEISIVSVPADPTVGVGRSQEEAESGPDAVFETYARLLQYNINISLKGGQHNDY